MDNLSLVEKLNLLGECTQERDRIVEKELSRTKEEYYPKPAAKETIKATKPTKTPIIIFSCIFLVLLIVGIVFISNAISSFSKASDLVNVVDNHGEAYELWLDSWNEAEYFSDLEEGWNAVEQDWKSRGVDVAWSRLEEIMQGNVINSLDFSNTLMRSISRDADNLTLVGVGQVFLALIFFIPGIIFAVKTKDRYEEWREKMDKFNKITEENEISRKYNEEELPKLVREWEENLPEMYEQYEKEMNSHRAKVIQLEEVIAQHAHLLPKNYHYWADEIASIISNRGNRCDIESAIKLHNAARDRCWQCINKNVCDYSIQSSFHKTGDVCPSYIPGKWY